MGLGLELSNKSACQPVQNLCKALGSIPNMGGGGRDGRKEGRGGRGREEEERKEGTYVLK
jgi:hypothetical protein